ncbi:uncharacterized protein EAE97_004915 [Botrytis byssoidea]|uniref:Uncharacterized protein n=1 Tax=Botrytis byssoidea TaxID=139641 RepID=A0A9P5M7A7_9HELO|nr:uncharacterized protein EAE97_004915 [Botrytis byssoidea]KAF7945877.1 hypothetical protein EAE97_004915 [Botrytis byssoidea]
MPIADDHEKHDVTVPVHVLLPRLARRSMRTLCPLLTGSITILSICTCVVVG